MSMLILPKLDTAGRLSPYILRRELVKHFRSLVVANTLQTNYVQDILASASPYFTPTGTVYMEHGLNGKGIRGDGTTGLLARNTSIPAQPLWMMAVFQCRTVSTPIKTITSLGAGDASTSYSFICAGNGTLSNIRGAVRGDTSGGTVNILGPVPKVNNLYSVVFSAPSNLLADGYLYVNGVKYTDPAPNAGNATFTNTWIYQAIGALKRNTTALFSNDFIYLTGYGLGEIPETLARDMSANPWHIFDSGKRFVYFDVAANSAVDLSGNATAQATASGTITQQLTISGASIATATATGVLNQALALSGSAAAITTIDGNATLTVDLSGAAFAQVFASADVNLTVSLSGNAVAQALSQANLTVTTPDGLAGNAVAVASASASLHQDITLDGSASATVSTLAGLDTELSLSGAAVTYSAMSGDLTVGLGGLSGSALSSLQATANLQLTIPLLASALSQALAQASLTVTGLATLPSGTYGIKNASPRRIVSTV